MTTQPADLFTTSDIHDRAFREYVSEFMRSYMPSIPMGILDCNDPEKWNIEVEIPERFKVVEIEVQPTVRETALAIADTEAGDGSLMAHLVTADDCDSAVLPWRCDYDGKTGDYGAAYWTSEDDAQSAADWLNECAADEAEDNRYGFPWAHGWGHMPDDRITTEELQAAGFIVATYQGPSDDIRLAGIDGGGYGFAEHHFAPLVYAFCKARGWPVPTDKGEITL